MKRIRLGFRRSQSGGKISAPGEIIFGSYRKANTPMHRVPLWIKAVVLFGISLLLVFTTWKVTAVALVFCVGLSYLAGINTGELFRMCYALRWLLLMLGLYYGFWGDWSTGADVLGTLLVAVLASRILLVSTPLPILTDAVVKLCIPLKLFGVNPERVGLAIMLMLRSIPAIMERWALLVNAAHARGLGRASYWRLLTPLVVQAVSYAHTLAHALMARGLDSSR